MRSKVRNFKAFYKGIHRIFLRPFFPNMPSYIAFLKQLKKQSKNLLGLITNKRWQMRKRSKFLHRFNAFTHLRGRAQ
jgi:FMN phosphatase YigB (HAD superfamily)